MLKAVDFNPSSVSRVCVRATNWIGDAVMSLPAIRAIHEVFDRAELLVVARPWIADLYARESAIDRVIPYPGGLSVREKWRFAAGLREQGCEVAILLQNAFDAAMIAWMAKIPERIGFRRDARGVLLTRAIPVPETGEIPRHERFYYLELLRRTGLIARYPECSQIRLEGLDAARAAGAAHMAAMGIEEGAIGISPGAAYGNAKRWLPERFAEAALKFAPLPVVLFGSKSERELCESVAAMLRGRQPVRNLAGETTLREFIDLAAACRLFLTNDSGASHIASAAGAPTVVVFGATDDTTTGPTGALARVVREQVECSPCLLRECPIDHRCMTRVTAERVASVAAELVPVPWIHEARF
jgi:heptosyltransferase-2